MAEKRRGGAKRSSVERAMTAARKSAESEVGALDNPDLQDEPSEIRHALYFLGVVGFGLTLNLIALLVVAAGD